MRVDKDALTGREHLCVSTVARKTSLSHRGSSHGGSVGVAQLVYLLLVPNCYSHRE